MQWPSGKRRAELQQILRESEQAFDAPGLIRLGDKAPIYLERRDWVLCYVDPSNSYGDPVTGAVAMRAITLATSRLIWIVTIRGRDEIFHAWSETPGGALNEAQTAFARRARIDADPDYIATLIRDLRRFRRKLTVTEEDARNSAICPEGVDLFLRQTHLEKVGRLPGWIVAWFTLFDRRVAYVLHEANQRQARTAQAETGAAAVERPSSDHRYIAARSAL